jgi:hypothetical protein
MKKFLTNTEKNKIIKEREKAIIESFAKNYNKIKHLDEDELDEAVYGDPEEIRLNNLAKNSPNIDISQLEIGKIYFVDTAPFNKIFDFDKKSISHWEPMMFRGVNGNIYSFKGFKNGFPVKADDINNRVKEYNFPTPYWVNKDGSIDENEVSQTPENGLQGNNGYNINDLDARLKNYIENEVPTGDWKSTKNYFLELTQDKPDPKRRYFELVDGILKKYGY